MYTAKCLPLTDTHTQAHTQADTQTDTIADLPRNQPRWAGHNSRHAGHTEGLSTAKLLLINRTVIIIY